MFSAMLLWSVLGAPVPDFRDKLGTTFLNNWPRSAESALFVGFDKAGENQAERAGFEPAVRCYSYADLANRCRSILKISPSKDLGKTRKPAVPSAVPLLPKELQELMKAWPDLPEPIRVGIVTLVRAFKDRS